MEIQIDSLGIDAALKLILVWHLFFQTGFYTESQFVILKVRHKLHIPFEKTVHFWKKHTLHDLPSCYHFYGTSNISVGGSD